MPEVYSYGETNKTVALIQRRLQDLGYFPKRQKCTGYYGDITKTAVIAFQKRTWPLPKGLSNLKQRQWKARYWDGVVGPMTWKALWPAPAVQKATAKQVIVSVVGTLVKNRPAAGYLMSQTRKFAVYGSSAKVVEANLVTVNFLGKDIKVHKIHAAQFKGVNDRIRLYEKNHNLPAYVPKQIGTFCWRKIRGGSSMSNHSFGIAIDLDWATNPMTSDPAVIKAWATSKGRIPEHVFKCFAAEGARSGRDYKTRKDYMHFEF